MLRLDMQPFFVKTKLFIPYLRTKLVERTRLLNRLNQGFNEHHRVLLIYAPAGFGKTTLVRAWIEKVNAPVAWFTIEPGDAHPRQFLNYLVNAVCQALPELADNLLPVLTASPPPPLDYVASLLVNKITEAMLPLPLIVVLDDYHHIETEENNAILTFLIDHLPAKTSIALTSRTLPDLPLSKLHARGQLTELNAQDLRFTPDETEDFFEINCGVRVEQDLLENLDRKTEGWAAGLQLLAMNLHEHSTLSDVLRGLSGNLPCILDYLAEEVLEEQPEETREFLKQISILDEVNPELAAATLEMDETSAADLISTIEKNNLFLFPLDQGRQWFRFHPLFLDVLRKKAHEFPPELLEQLHAAASRWFNANDMVEEAIQHTLAAGDQAQAAQMIDENAETMLLTGKYEQYLQFIDALAPEFTGSTPIMLVYQATAMLFSEYSHQSIQDVLVQAEALTPKGSLTGEIGAIKAIIKSYTSDPQKGIEFSKKALGKIDASHTFFRNLVERNLGVAYMLKNDLLNASHWFEKLLLSSYALNDWGGILAAYNYLTYIRKVQGRLKEAGVIYKKALAFIEAKNLELMPHAIKIIAGYGHLLLQWHQLEEAKVHFKRAIHLGKKTDVFYAHSAYQNLSEAFIRENDTRSALATIQKLRYLSQGKQDLYQSIHDQHTLAVEARIHLEAGRIERAYIWLISSGIDKLSPDEMMDKFGFEMGFILPVAARIYLAKNKPGRAIQILESFIPKFIQQNANAYLTRAFNTLAIAYAQTKQMDQAVRALTKAIELAEPEEDIGDFMIVGRKLVPLLYDSMAAGIAPKFTRRLLNLFATFDPSRRSPGSDLVNIDPLSQRELDVLELIAQGKTNQEIAQDLYLSTNTIKSHSVKIYRKLNVNNRNQAVSKARLLGILPNHSPGITRRDYPHLRP